VDFGGDRAWIICGSSQDLPHHLPALNLPPSREFTSRYRVETRFRDEDIHQLSRLSLRDCKALGVLIVKFPRPFHSQISMGCFVLSMLVCYRIWGRAFVNEFLLYHISRTDTRHNFSPYFYPLYLASTNADLSRLIGSLAFLPQATAIVVFAFR
jgi:hypothetical protein